ncbi:MAG: hypothetical protein NVSMB51_16180 [Solirubrobacteraceae bacterium]
MTWLGVALAGSLGALARHGLELALPARGQLLVNLSGCLALGVLVGAGVAGGAYELAGTALLGSFTTWSGFVLRLERGGGTRYLLLSIGLGLAAIALGRAAA